MYRYPATILGLIFVLGARGAPSTSTDDFGFDTEDSDLTVDVLATNNEEKLTKNRGIPDATAEPGKLFDFRIPNDAFTGKVSKYEVKSPLPSWLSYSRGTFLGIPIPTDKPNVLVSVVARSAHNAQNAHDVFRIQIRQKPMRFLNPQCSRSSVVLVFYVEEILEKIQPRRRLTAITNLSGFLGLNASDFYLSSQKQFLDSTDSSVKFAGPSNVQNYEKNQPVTSMELQVGCNGALWRRFEPLIQQIREQSLDGTLSEVLSLPLLGWRVINRHNSLDRGRRDTYYGPDDDYELNYDDMYDGDYDEENEGNDDDDGGVTTIIPILTDETSKVISVILTEKTTVASTTARSTTADKDVITETHPHRHHHGELPNKEVHLGKEVEIPEIPTQAHVTIPVISTTTQKPTTPNQETIGVTLVGSTDDDTEDDYDDREEEILTEVPVVGITEPSTSNNPIITTTEKLDTTMMTVTENVTNVTEVGSTDKEEEIEVISSSATITEATTAEPTTQTTTRTTQVGTTTMELPTETFTTLEIISTTWSSSSSAETVPPIVSTISSSTTISSEAPTTTSTTEAVPSESSSTITTTSTTVTSTEKTTVPSSTTERTTTETIEYGFKNFPPQILHRLKKIHVPAGTVLRYTIPENTFQDIEDGWELKLRFIDPSPKRNEWLHFDERNREVYGLPLEEHVSKYDFLVQATDKEGASVSDKLEVIVQQHKGSRTFTHEFLLQIRVEKKSDFPSPVDWQLQTLRGLSKLFNNKDLSQIVVRSVEYNQDFVTFAWTNDTLPKSHCPKTELDYLLSVMTANSDGDPSYTLSQVLGPELRVKKVELRGIGQCEEKPELPPVPPKAHPTNFSPIPRNQVDHINATEGELLVFKVPDDTFYDPEDGNARNLKMSLLTMDRRALPKDHWLQFDIKNQEFYGIPLRGDVGRSEYQLVCEDRGGLTANDGLIVVVFPSPNIQYNVEFKIVLDISYEVFVNSASLKRKFAEKLQEVFRDKDTSNIHISSISEGSTIVKWNNKTLPTDSCPDIEIKRLRRILMNDDQSLPDRIYNIFDNELQVKTISLTPQGICQGDTTIVHPPDQTYPDESLPSDSTDEYLITFVVPAIIIAVMLILAGIVACVLYRRRRSGKMNVEDERQTFRNKGIPVIFQDEIDEKPDSGTKAPVILKEEKPPLAPPEYSKRNTPVPDEREVDVPYQPPPPFTASQNDSNRQSRPKPTPTYRKPPPYVPP